MSLLPDRSSHLNVWLLALASLFAVGCSKGAGTMDGDAAVGVPSDAAAIEDGAISHRDQAGEPQDLSTADLSGNPPAGNYDTRVGMGADPDGVPILGKHANARYIYFNPTHPAASDANPGTDPALPKATLSNAWAALRDGMGDWLLLAQGSTYAEGFGALAPRNGLSAEYPIVVTTYDPAAPTDVTKMRKGLATVATKPSSTIFYAGDSAGARTVFENIVFDKQNDSTEAVSGLGPIQRDLMFYNVRFFRTQVSFQGDFAGNVTDGKVKTIVFRRCVFAYSYAGGGHSQGMYLWATDGVTVEDSIFYHNGWTGTDRDTASDPPDIFRHNAYYGTLTFNTIFRRNVSAQASSHGLQLRGGGEVSDCVFAGNPLNLLVGGGNDYNLYRPQGVPYSLTNNVIVGSSNIDSANPRGGGIGFINTQDGGKADGNLVVNISASSTANQIAYAATAEFDQPTYVNLTNNVAWSWGNEKMVDYAGAYPAQVHITSSGNILPNETPTGTNRTSPATPFPDPSRTIASYATSNGYADEQALWDYVIHHPEINWAKSIGDYVRAGFGK